MKAKRLAIGLALVALFGVLACSSSEERLAHHLERGNAFLQQKKPAEAVIEFKSALQIDPNRADAHYGLAKAYLAQRQVRKAYWELHETVRLDPDNLEARLAYGQFLLLGGEEEAGEALDQADAVLAKQPKRAEAFVLKARALERLERYDEAKQAYLDLLRLEPDKPAWIRAYAGFLTRRGAKQQAEAQWRRLTEVDPGFASYADLGRFLARDRERADEAEAALREALARAKDKERPAAYQLLAGFYFAGGNTERAEKVLRQGLEAVPGNLDLIYALARLYAARGEREQANRMMEEATRAHPDQVRPFLVLSLYRGQMGDLDGALEAAEGALRADPTSQAARLRKAELLVDLSRRKGEDAEARRGEARKIVAAVLKESPSSPEAKFVEAKIDLVEGKLDAAVKRLRSVIAAKPDWPQAHFVLATALLTQHDRQGARAELARAVDLDPQFRSARKLLARVALELGDDQAAAEQARQALKLSPEDTALRIVLAQSLVRQGKTQEALTELGRIPESRRDAAVHFALARVNLLLGKAQPARKELEAALAARPFEPELLETLLLLDQTESRVDEALARIEKAQKARPESGALARLHGVALLLTGKREEGEAELRHAIELDPQDLAAYRALGRYLVESHRLDEGIATFEKALAARPDSAPLHVTLGSLYENKGERDRAQEHYERAIQLDPNLGVAKNNLAYLLAEEGRNLDRALDLAQEAKRLLPRSPSAADTLGWVLVKKGIPEAAIPYLKEAESGFPPGSVALGEVRVHLAKAYEARGERKLARETLERALAELDAARERARSRGARPGPEPAWAAAARADLERLRSQGEGATGSPSG